MATTLRPTLERIRKLLSTRPRTALEIATLTGCSKPTAYAQLRQLKAHGVKFTRERVRQGASGPKAHAYRISGA